MVEPNIVAFRIDERLVHGQGQLRIKVLGVSTVIVVNDSASEDPIQQTLTRAMVPKAIAMRSFSVRHTYDVIMKASSEQTIFIVCRTTGDALKLVAGRAPVKEINVGSTHHTPSKGDIGKYTVPGENDKAALRKMRDQYGVIFNIKTTAPGDDGAIKVGLGEYL